MQTLFAVIGILSLVAYIVSTMMIYGFLERKGIKVSFTFIRLFMISYADRYRKITREETGRTGYLFYIWIISVWIALGSAVLALFVFS